MKHIILAVLMLSAITVASQSIEGVWKTYDDDGKDKSLVKIEIRDGKLYGTIIKLFEADGDSKKCEDCPGTFNGKKIVGLQIINGLTKKGNEWLGDKSLFDPKGKKEYNAKIWLENDKLKVRGYIGFLYSTQEWTREK